MIGRDVELAVADRQRNPEGETKENEIRGDEQGTLMIARQIQYPATPACAQSSLSDLVVNPNPSRGSCIKPTINAPAASTHINFYIRFQRLSSNSGIRNGAYHDGVDQAVATEARPSPQRQCRPACGL